MRPVLYETTETRFRTFGLGEISDTVLCEVTRERNGGYRLYLEYPLDGAMALLLVKGRKIKADAGTRTKWQTFEIVRVVKDSGDCIKVYANHISHATESMAIKPVKGQDLTAGEALVLWRENLIGDVQFDVWSDITTRASPNWTVEGIASAREALGGVAGSILDLYGGEYEWDNTTIRLHKQLGRRAPIVLEYGRNLLKVESDEDMSDTYTSIFPYVKYTAEDNREVILTLPEYVVDGARRANFPQRLIKKVDLSSKFADKKSVSVEQLRAAAEAYVKANRVGLPKIEITVEYVDLAATLDYSDLAVMEEVDLCDIIPLWYPEFGLTSTSEKVVEVVYDVLNDENKRIKLGTIGRTITSQLTGDVIERVAELEKAQAETQVNVSQYLLNGTGNKIWQESPGADAEHKIGDVWFEKNGRYDRMYIWNGNMWEKILDTEDVDRVKREVDEEVAKINQQMATNAAEHNAAVADLLDKAGVSQSLAEEAKRGADQAKSDAIKAIASVQNAKSEVIAEAQRLDAAERQATTAKLATLKSEAVAEASRLVDGAKTVLATEIASANQAIKNAKTALETQVSGVRTDLTRTNDTIKTLATKTDLSTLTGRVSTAETSLTQQAGQIALKANKNDVDTLAGRVGRAETSITQQAGQIALKANTSDVNTLTNRMQTAEASITTQAGQIALKANQSDVDGVKGRLNNAESSITQQANQIKQMVKTSDFNQVTGRLSTAESSIRQLGNRITTEIGETVAKIPTGFGARNYAEDYDFSRGLWEYTQGDSSQTTRGTTDGVFTMTSTTTTWHQWQIYSESGMRLGGRKDSTALLELKEGETYTLSVEIKVSSGDPNYWFEIRDNGENNYNNIVSHVIKRGVATNQWQRYSVTFVVKPNADFGHRRIILGYSAIGSISFRKVEITQSSQFMDAGPAPEDTMSEITATKTIITQTAEGQTQLSTRLTETAGKVTATETRITQLVGEVGSKVSQTDFNNLRGTVNNHTTAITQANNAIALRAEKTYVDGVKSTADAAKASAADALAKATTNASNITKATAEIKVVSDAIKTLVTKTDFNAATQRLSTAETSINTMAGEITKRLTSSQVEQAITGKGYQTKAQVDNNITGRGYITEAGVNNKLTGYVSATTYDNQVVETAKEYKRLISETKGLIPANVSHRNLAVGSSDKWNNFINITKNNNWIAQMTRINYGDSTGIYTGSKVNLLVYISADDIVLDSSISTPRIILQGPGYAKSTNAEVWGNPYNPIHGRWTSPLKAGNNYHLIKVTADVTNVMANDHQAFGIQIRIDGANSGKFHWRALTVTTGDVAPNYWTQPIEDFATVTAYNEVKSTVDSHTRTIASQGTSISQVTQTAAGLVTRVGTLETDAAKKSDLTSLATKTEVSTLAGSWAVRNLTSAGAVLNQINVNKDGTNRIDGSLTQITGKTVIENGVIKSAMIANGQIGTAHIGTIDAAIANIINLNANKIVGLDAAFIKAKIENAFVDWMKGKVVASQNGNTNFNLNNGHLIFNDNNTGVFRIQNNATAMGLRFSNNNITVNGSSYIQSRLILGGDRWNAAMTDANWNAGGFSGVIVESVKGLESPVYEAADRMWMVSDKIYMTHTLGSSQSGWVVEPLTATGKGGVVAIRPFGVASNKSAVTAGDIIIAHSNGRENSLRAAIRALKNGFQHIINGGVSENAINALRNLVNDALIKDF